MIPFRPIIYLLAVMYVGCMVTEVHEKRLKVKNKNGMTAFSNSSAVELQQDVWHVPDS